MKQHVGLTIDADLLTEIERLRGLVKRSTFVEHLLRLGLESYAKGNQQPKIPKCLSDKYPKTQMPI